MRAVRAGHDRDYPRRGTHSHLPDLPYEAPSAQCDDEPGHDCPRTRRTPEPASGCSGPRCSPRSVSCWPRPGTRWPPAPRCPGGRWCAGFLVVFAVAAPLAGRRALAARHRRRAGRRADSRCTRCSASASTAPRRPGAGRRLRRRHLARGARRPAGVRGQPVPLSPADARRILRPPDWTRSPARAGRHSGSRHRTVAAHGQRAHAHVVQAPPRPPRPVLLSPAHAARSPARGAGRRLAAAAAATPRCSGSSGCRTDVRRSRTRYAPCAPRSPAYAPCAPGFPARPPVPAARPADRAPLPRARHRPGRTPAHGDQARAAARAARPRSLTRHPPPRDTRREHRCRELRARPCAAATAHH